MHVQQGRRRVDDVLKHKTDGVHGHRLLVVSSDPASGTSAEGRGLSGCGGPLHHVSPGGLQTPTAPWPSERHTRGAPALGYSFPPEPLRFRSELHAGGVDPGAQVWWGTGVSSDPESGQES